jgi:hypothetical protein
MELRGVGGPGLRRAAPGRAGFVALACGLFLGAAVLTTAPAIRHAWTDFLAGGAPGYGEAAPGDHLQTGYRLWLAGHQLENGRHPWRDPYSFRPEAEQTPNSTWWPYGVPYWPLWRLLGAVRAWNAFVLLTFVGAGLLTLAWLRETGLCRVASLAGGLAFEIAPYRAMQTTGHLLGPISLMLPLSLWAFERARRARWRFPWLLLSIVALASIPLSGQVHLALGAIPFYAAYVLVRTRDPLALAGAAVALAGTIVAGWAIQRYTISGTLDAGERSLSEVATYSADWLDFVVRHKRHGSESFVFLGWVTPLIALAGLLALVSWRRWGLAIVLGLGALVPMLLALGTTTPLYEAARFVFPPLRYPRVPERLMPIACLALAALVAFAVQALADSRFDPRLTAARRTQLVGAIAVIVLLVDLRVTVFHASAADEGNRAYAAIRSRPPDARLLELPVFLPSVHFGSVYLYYDMRARRERPGGYSTTAPIVADEVARKLLPLNCGDWTTRPQKLLRDLGVRDLTFHRGLFLYNPAAPDRAWFAWRGLVTHGYRPVAHDGRITLLRRSRRGPPTRAPVREPAREGARFCGNWYPNDGEGRAMAFGHAGFWIHGSGELRLFMRSAKRLRVTFGVDGRPRFRRFVIRSLQEVRVPLGREGWHLVTLDSVLPEVDGRPEGARIVAYAPA